ncbi:MAG: glycosyltransferase family 2 protein [Pontibacterium sp.]
MYIKKENSGWHELSIFCAYEAGISQVHIKSSSADFSKNYNLSVRPERKVRYVVYLPYEINEVKITNVEFPENKGYTENINFKLNLKRITALSAWYRILNRLRNVVPVFWGKNFLQVVLGLHFQSKGIFKDFRAHVLEMYQRTYCPRSLSDEYARWIEEDEQLCSDRWWNAYTNGGLVNIRYKLFFLLPVTKSFGSTSGLLLTLDSIKAQTLPQWCCLLTVSPDDYEVVSALVKPFREAGWPLDIMVSEKSHLAAELNTALSQLSELTTAESWILILRQGDILGQDMVRAIGSCAGGAACYEALITDEDYLGADGVRCEPVFKPGWNPDMLRSTSYTGRSVLLRRSLLDQLGGYRVSEHSASAEALVHDVLLRAAVLPGNEGGRFFTRIPVILYHCRPGKVADNTSFMAEAVKQSLHTNVQGRAVQSVAKNTFRVQWSLPKYIPQVSLLIPTRDHLEVLRPCIETILERTLYLNFELLILDNQSNCIDTLAYLEQISQRDHRVRVLRWNHPFNYSAINNFGARYARGSVLALINNDIEPVASGWLEEMVSHACRLEVGCVGAKLYYPCGKIQHAGVVLGVGGVAGHGHRFLDQNDDGYMFRLKLVQNVSAVTGACLVLRKAVFEEAGGLNQVDLAVNYSDVDLCLKVREAGYVNLWTPYAELIHHESVSRRAGSTSKKRVRALREAAYMRSTWGEQLDNDPAYNPNLTLTHEDFSLR